MKVPLWDRETMFLKRNINPEEHPGSTKKNNVINTDKWQSQNSWCETLINCVFKDYFTLFDLEMFSSLAERAAHTSGTRLGMEDGNWSQNGCFSSAAVFYSIESVNVHVPLF